MKLKELIHGIPVLESNVDFEIEKDVLIDNEKIKSWCI